MTATQKATSKLWSFNQWLLPIFVTSVLSLTTWSIVQIFSLKERVTSIEMYEKVEDHADAGDMKALRAEMNERTSVANENRKRIEALESTRIADSISLAKIQSSLEDIRDRFIRFEENHNKNSTSTP